MFTAQSLFFKRLKNEWNVIREQEEKLKYCSFILGMAGVTEKKRWFVLKKPLIFRNSTPLFKKRSPENMLAELCIKSFFRKWSQVKFYLQYMIVSAAAVFSVPIWLKWIVWIILAFLLANWIRSYWKEVQFSPYLGIFQWNHEDMISACKKSMFFLTMLIYRIPFFH